MSDHPVDVESMSDIELDEYAWQHFVDAPDAWSESWLREMSPVVRAYVATTAFEFTVGNGGLTQLFENWESDPWLIDAAIEGYKFLGLYAVARTIAEQILPVANSASEKQLRDRVRRGESSPVLQGSALNALDPLVGDHTSLRVRLIRADPPAFGLRVPAT